MKPENFLLDDNFVLKLADFGFAAPTMGRDGSGYLNTKLGTLNYMAPEIHNKESYEGVYVDIFAAGIILFIIYTGVFPFEKASRTDTFYRALIEKPDNFWEKQEQN